MLTSLRRRGLLYTFAILFNRVVPELLFRCRFYTVFQMRQVESIGTNSTVECAKSNADDVEFVEALTGFQSVVNSGESTPWQAQKDGEIVAGFWSATQSFDEKELGVRVLLDHDQAWLFSAFVDKRYRGQRVFPQLLQHTLRTLVDEHSVRQYAGVNPVNRSSMKVFENQSQGRVGAVLAIRILNTVFCWSFGKISRDRTIAWNGRKKPVEIRITQ